MTITLPEDIAQRLNAFATAQGIDPASAIAALLEREVAPERLPRLLADALKGKIGVVDSRTVSEAERIVPATDEQRAFARIMDQKRGRIFGDAS